MSLIGRKRYVSAGLAIVREGSDPKAQRSIFNFSAACGAK